MNRKLQLLLPAAIVVAAVYAGASAATYRGANGRLAFAVMGANVDILSVRPDGRDAQRLTTGKSFDACPSWSRDGTTIAYCSDASGRYEIWTMRANGAGKHRETNLGSNATFPDLAPDGRRIVFSDCARTCRLMVVDRATGKETVVVDDPAADETEPVWSPNGMTIAYLHTPKGGTPQIFLVNANGSHARQLTKDARRKGPFGPDWKPGGSMLAYGAAGDIWAVDLRGRTRRLTTTDAVEYAPAWAPDGGSIAFLRETGTMRRVYLMRADGSGVHAVAPALGARQLVPAWQPLPR